MNLQVRTTPEADAQIGAIDEWGRDCTYSASVATLKFATVLK